MKAKYASCRPDLNRGPCWILAKLAWLKSKVKGGLGSAACLIRLGAYSSIAKAVSIHEVHWDGKLHTDDAQRVLDTGKSSIMTAVCCWTDTACLYWLQKSKEGLAKQLALYALVPTAACWLVAIPCCQRCNEVKSQRRPWFSCLPQSPWCLHKHAWTMYLDVPRENERFYKL